MQRELFEKYLEDNKNLLNAIENTACYLHASVNQMYGNNLPYSHHLTMVAKYAARYGHLAANTEEDVIILISSAWLHDTIEDTRQTYNNILRLLSQIMPQYAYKVAEVVYALTNEKGKNREQRANDKYYCEMSKVPLAPFVKMCDRLANIEFSSTTMEKSGKLDVYTKEFPSFWKKINQNEANSVSPQLKTLAEEILKTAAERKNTSNLV